ncbi:bifunctional phosphoribosylaminoimidazolecarboxamide formyltransferase/IMP cyclohydrolase [Auritidibacter ignavus]|uniref:bifunctional phosphoribosylaminoimidazolecarboxamide formyltransferase/IMP cyclohydrolase n=1 Tax=Auritidibacter ignavus TaxID=678932 RepID=UPI000F03287B|nr:bifunctional phosphoribosylaminoimidazolecarboxamide formyltransferase/IMP cyclohydrolase PurH [Auritidibacter ignavus]
MVGVAGVAESTDKIPFKRALISVYDKTGLQDLARGLADAGVQIVSTGSTAKTIASTGVDVTEVADITGFPEVLDGRVKTLHPRIHAGILADRRLESHRAQLDEHHIEPFDLVIVNLYPFVETVGSGAGEDDVIEKIDIGGPSMVRAAAKNHPSIAVVVDPRSYQDVVTAAQQGGFDLATRKRLASLAFAHTAAYDNAVAAWTAAQFGEAPEQESTVSQLPPYVGVSLSRAESLRYGENPHQPAALYVEDGASTGIAQAQLLHGKPMSYNNYVDADAAVRAAFDFSDPAVAIIKHANPCGLAVGDAHATDPIADAHAKAHATDPVSAFGGVIAANREITATFATQVKDIFTEVMVAPSFSAEAVEILSAKKNLRLLELPAGFHRDSVEYKQVSGGMLLQVADTFQSQGDNPADWELVSGEPADETTLADLAFAWKAVRAAKSNAILLAHQQAAVGIGMGQVNRLDSCRLAIERANTLGMATTGAQQTGTNDQVRSVGGASNPTSTEQAPVRARGSVAASDAFFPFPDGLQILIDAGVRAVVQPGGSIRDEDVIATARQAGITMYLTHSRHFYHG